MADEGYTFDEDAARRIINTVREVEAMPIGTNTRKRVPASGVNRAPNIQTVRVTSTTLTSGRYPGKRQEYDPTTNTVTDGTDVWVVPPDPAGSLGAGYYEARAVGEVTVSGATRMVFKATGFLGSQIVDFISDMCPIFSDSIAADFNGGTWT